MLFCDTECNAKNCSPLKSTFFEKSRKTARNWQKLAFFTKNCIFDYFRQFFLIFQEQSCAEGCGFLHCGHSLMFTLHKVSHVRCHMSGVSCQVSGVTTFIFINSFFLTKSQPVEGLLPTDTTLPSFSLHKLPKSENVLNPKELAISGLDTSSDQTSIGDLIFIKKNRIENVILLKTRFILKCCIKLFFYNQYIGSPETSLIFFVYLIYPPQCTVKDQNNSDNFQ